MHVGTGLTGRVEDEALSVPHCIKEVEPASKTIKGFRNPNDMCSKLILFSSKNKRIEIHNCIILFTSRVKNRSAVEKSKSIYEPGEQTLFPLLLGRDDIGLSTSFQMEISSGTKSRAETAKSLEFNEDLRLPATIKLPAVELLISAQSRKKYQE